MSKEINVVKQLICKLLKEDNWFEVSYRFSKLMPVRKFNDLKIAIRNRIHPFNVLKIDQLSRDWHDRDDILFHASFQVLVDFVEQEYPYQPRWDDDENDLPLVTPDQMRAHIEDWLGPERCKKDREHYIAQGWDPDMCGHGNTMRQYRSSMELIELYDWYKFRRPAKIAQQENYIFCIKHYMDLDPIDAMLGDTITDEEFEQDTPKSPRVSNLVKRIRSKIYKDENGVPYPKLITSEEHWDIERENDMIDQLMLHRLIDARHAMWT